MLNLLAIIMIVGFPSKILFGGVIQAWETEGIWESYVLLSTI